MDLFIPFIYDVEPENKFEQLSLEIEPLLPSIDPNIESEEDPPRVIVIDIL